MPEEWGGLGAAAAVGLLLGGIWLWARGAMELVDRLLGETGAVPLPDLRAARGRPFAGFRDLTAFEEDVLVAEEGGSTAPPPARPGFDPGRA